MNEGEKRKAKRNRGWAVPEDKFNRKMEGRRREVGGGAGGGGGLIGAVGRR